MAMRSLTEAEADRRSALLAVERYDMEIDLTDLPTGPAVRCVSTVEFTCSGSRGGVIRGLRCRGGGGDVERPESRAAGRGSDPAA